MNNSTDKKVSIIIRTFNESQYIEELLMSIRSQTISDTEIIIVDSESTDNTVQIASKYLNKLVQIKKAEFTFGYSLNKGIEVASSNNVILISAHTKPLHSKWIENLITPLSNPEVAMTYGKQIGDSKSRYSEFRDLLRTFPSHPKVHTAPDFFSHNANSCLRKSFWDIHKFDETLTGQEDIEWARHWMLTGYTIFYEPNAPILHSHYETNKQIKHRFKRESYAMKKLGLLNISFIPVCLIREILRGIIDLFQIGKHKNHKNKITDIFVYRYCKITGTISGIISK